jgi:hypothetical protein
LPTGWQEFVNALPSVCTPLPPDSQDFAKGCLHLPVTANHLPTVCLQRICQRFACDSDGQAFANGLPATAKHLPTVCLRLPSICQPFACAGHSFANGLPVTAKRGGSIPSRHSLMHVDNSQP